MSFIEALRHHLRNTTSIGNLTGDAIGISHNDEDDSEPRIVLNQIDGPGEYSLDGDTGVTIGIFQIDCIDDTKTGCLDLASAVDDELSGMRRTIGDDGAQFEVRACHRDDTRDDYAGPNDDGEVTTYVRQLDYRIGYRAAN